MTETTVDSDLRVSFVNAMANVAAPVSIVTVLEDGQPHGTTVSAFCSLSIAPPMVLVSLDNSSRLLPRLLKAGRFGLNVLADDQAALARHFASKSDEKFSTVEFDASGGSPRLAGTTSWLMCDVFQATPGGDHTVIIGAVTEAGSAPIAPLTYYLRTFGTHIAHP